jgi:formylglycine-generating enzyme required for sulfatase activity
MYAISAGASILLALAVQQPSLGQPVADAVTPAPLVAPFTPQQAAEAQVAWSKVAGTPVHITNGAGMKLTLIPPGQFLMGSTDADEESSRSEQPQHRVRITRPFYVGTYEVTQVEYERVMRKNPSRYWKAGDEARRVRGLDTSRFPVESVTWDNAVAFCGLLSGLAEEQQAGRTYRLPTEAEWEYACRAGTTAPFHVGWPLELRQANFSHYQGRTTGKASGVGRPAPVGSYRPSAFGLFDLHGNVWEWCADSYDVDYYAHSPADDPHCTSNEFARLVRGGSWEDLATACRSANRFWYQPKTRLATVGFRVVAEMGGE